MLHNQKINRRDFFLNLSQSALVMAILGRNSQLLTAKPKKIYKSSSILDISLAQYLRNQGASEEALRLMNIYPLSMNDIDSASALWGMRNAQREQNRSSNIMRIKGGNSRLTEALTNI